MVVCKELQKQAVPAMTFLATRLKLDDDNYLAPVRLQRELLETVKTLARQASTPSRKFERWHISALLDLP